MMVGGDLVAEARLEAVPDGAPTPGRSAAASRDPIPEHTISERYAVERLLRQGRGIETWLATDRTTGAPVVVKTTSLSALSPVARMRLEHEAEVLGRITGDTLAPILELCRDATSLVLVMPLIAGITLEERLQLGALPMSGTLTVARCVLRALVETHQEGVLHRDIKPANVIIRGDAEVEHATLIDFGFARSEQLDPALRDLPVGTAQYVSPEQAGLLAEPVDERSDLYSLGVMLFRCLSGRLPFQATTVGAILREHLTVPAPRLRPLGVELPRAMDEVVQRLLRKDPRDRYQSAASALADIEEIASAMAAGELDPALVVGLHDRRRMLTEPAFVGRAAELRALRTHLDRIASGSSALVTVEAESGGGKSRLLEEFAQEAGRAGVVVHRGQGTDQVAQRPLQVFESVAESVAAVAAADPAFAALLRNRLAEDAAAAAEAMPVLAPVLAGDGGGGLPEAHGEARTMQALGRLLTSIAGPGRPAVVVLDDCQWADDLAVKLIQHWWRHSATGPDADGLLVVVAYRSEEVGAGHPLRQLQPADRVVLEPFGDEDVRQLITSMAGALPEAATQLIARLSSGSPLMAAAVLRGLVETEALVDDAEGWSLDESAIAELQTSRRAATILVRRLELLPEATLRLLSVAAVLGKAFDPAVATALAGQTSTQVIPALNDCRKRHLIWLDEEVGRAAFVHDKIREALLGRLGEEERRALHRAAADHLERSRSDAVFELAYHFDAAAEPARALPYALTAATQARAQHALQLAEAQFRIAERGVGESPPAAQREVTAGLGDVLMLRGQYHEAQRCFERVLELSSSAGDQAAIHGRLGELAFKRGDMRTAGDECERALRYLGRRTPHATPLLLLLVLWEAAIQLMHTLLPRLLVGRRGAPPDEAPLLAARLYSRLAYTYWFRAGRVPCAWSHLRGLNLTERYTPTAERAQAYSEHAPVMTMAAYYRRGIEYAERSLTIRTDLGDLWGQGQSLSFAGVVLYAASRYRESMDRCRQAVRRLERTGDQWEVNTARWHIAFAHYRLGELAAAVATSRQVYEAGVEIGDWSSAGISLGAWSKASGGDVPADLFERELRRGGDDAHTRVELLQGEAVRLLRSGDASAATEALLKAQEVVRRAGLRQEYVAPVGPWLATCVRTQIEALPGHAVARRRELLGQARRVARRAHRLARSYRNNLPHALRERALIAALDGDERRTRRWLDESIRVAVAQEARQEEALSRLARGGVGAALGWAGAEEERAAAQRTLDGLREGLGHAARAAGSDGDGTTLALADRFTTVVDVGRRIAACGTREAVFEAVHEAALLLLRGDRCVVLEVAGREDGSALVVSGSMELGFSRSLANQAVMTGHPVIVAPDPHGDTSESIDIAAVRSALYAPIAVQGTVIACFGVTHGTVQGLFGEDEERLAEYIATLAGAALENAAGSEARFRSLVQHSSDVITVVDGDGLVAYVSPSVARVFGYDPSEVLGRPLTHLVHVDDASRLLAALASQGDAVDTGPPVECRWLHRDGSWRYCDSVVNSQLEDPAVRGVILNTRDISERRRAEGALRQHADRLAELTEMDPLTGLGNRRFFDRQLETASTDAFAVLAIDLDNLKAINDLYGHEAGDEALRLLAPVIRGVLREHDIVARLGGDEFAAVLPGVDLGAAQAIAERIREAMYGVAAPTGQARVSIGCAAGSAGADPRHVLREADAALFHAKRGGRDRVVAARSGTVGSPSVPEGKRWEAILARTLADGSVGAAYQPIVDLADGSVLGYEALARPSGLDAAASVEGLFATALRLGVARDLDWLCRRSVMQEWRDRRPGVLLFINIGVTNLLDPLHDPDQMLLLGRWAGLGPEGIVLEITEREAVQDLDRLRDVLAEYRSHGFRFAIDDLGDGRSTLAVLSTAVPEFLKIAGSVTRNAGDPGSRHLISATLAFAAGSGSQVVAENLETPEDIVRMRDLGVTLGQGFALGRPDTADHLLDTEQRIRRSVTGLRPVAPVVPLGTPVPKTRSEGRVS